MMNLSDKYSRDTFLKFIKDDFITDFVQDTREVFPVNNSIFQKVTYLGESKSLDLQVFEFVINGSDSRRLALAKEAFAIMKSKMSFRAVAVFYSLDLESWRFSLMTATPIRSGSGKVTLNFSNPRRLSYLLGPHSKVNTPTKYLVSLGKVRDFNDLTSRFSLEVVNKEFYKEISSKFIELVEGFNEDKKTEGTKLLLPKNNNVIPVRIEFAVRLIGRLIFCWFLREKKALDNSKQPLMPPELLSLATANITDDYYKKVLEPIFFETLNKPVEYRKDTYKADKYLLIPYLNGGLFAPHDDDFYLNHELFVSDAWIRELFQILELYNFTIDENTTYDGDLSIDPEMLGRIFENLLAEINPETGESARKSTGSYYTPRNIVEYMVDESILEYLLTRSDIEKSKLTALVSYDLTDDLESPLSDEEKQKVVDLLEKVKILDPACGSGAFPMGALQKIVFILQQIDPEGHMWFKKQIMKTSPEVRRILEKEFNNKNFDYVRKLGIIRENIYGVDIQPVATEISRLRCFLTLVVDQAIDDGEKNRGIYPLPNLDFKFVCANTLVSSPDSNWGTLGLDNGFQEDFTSTVSSYFGASDPLEKQYALNKLHSLIDQKVEENVNMVINDSSVYKDKRLQSAYKASQKDKHGALLHTANLWKSYKNIFSNKKVEFFDLKYFFPSIDNGFDIVIANPPYIKEYTQKSAFDGLRDSPYYKGKMDLWYLFACKCIDFLKSDGILTFIAQNNWTTSYGASILRDKVLKETKIIELIDFGDYKVFESAGIQTMIMVFKKNMLEDAYKVDYRRIKIKELNYNVISTILAKQLSSDVEYFEPTINRKHLVGKSLNLNNSTLERVLQLIEAKGNFRLSANEVANGIHHHHDIVDKNRKAILGDSFSVGEGIFVINNEEKDALMLTEQELTLIKPSYTTKNIFRWYGNPINTEWVIYTDSTFKDTKKIENYPHIKAHLDRYKKVITSDNKPYGLHRARDERFFIGAKIVSPRKCVSPAFSYIDFNSYISASFYLIKTSRIDMQFLTALLNSKLIQFWLKNKGKMQGNNYQIDKEPLLGIPLNTPTMDDINKIIEVTNTIIEKIKANNFSLTNLDISSEEKIINKVIYEIYKVDDEGIKIIEDNLNEQLL